MFSERTSDESVRSHDSAFEDNSAAVYITTGGGGYCNGTLIAYKSQLYVWTTAHALVDVSQADCKKLHANIKLLLPINYTDVVKSGHQQLLWKKAIHSYQRFPWAEEAAALAANQPVSFTIEAQRVFDVLVFELDTAVHADLAGRARVPFEPQLGHREHDTVEGRAYKPSVYPRPPAASPEAAAVPDYVAEKIHETITSREVAHPLGTINAVAIAGSSGAGLIDKEKHYHGCIASVAEPSPGAQRTVLILPEAFRQLLTSSDSISVPNSNFLAEKAVIAP